MQTSSPFTFFSTCGKSQSSNENVFLLFKHSIEPEAYKGWKKEQTRIWISIHDRRIKEEKSSKDENHFWYKFADDWSDLVVWKSWKIFIAKL